MALAPGTRIGSYEVVRPLGVGGMGEVYRARDTKLGRDVALKILPQSFAADHDRLMRFEREAKTLASLNHPNIAAIYGIESPSTASGLGAALVMELVEGEDLSAIIARGAMPAGEALPIARQIADALEAAHESGIIHRDLKPANIRVRPDGTVKVLDFGLARTLDAGLGTPDSDSSPTMTSPTMTHMGTVLGTAAYMAPEQARGKPVDRRADIWSFGAVLFEMISGTRAFAGADMLETLSSVIGKTPDWSAIPPATPPRVRELIERCLTRNPRQRLQSIAEARIVLERAINQPDRDAAAATPVRLTRSRGRRALPWAVAVVMAAIAASSWALRRPASHEPRVIRLLAELSPDATVVPAVGPAIAFSPDGNLLAFRGKPRGGDTPMIFIRRLDQLAAQPLSGTENVTDMFFSPDGQWLGFFTDPNQALKKIPVTGGSAVTICAVLNARGGDWLDSRRIVFATSSRAALSVVSVDGGTREPLTQLDAATGEITHRFPQVLPGGKAVLYTAHTNSLNFDDANVYAQPLQGSAVRKLVLRGGYLARYVASGHLLYMHENALFAIVFDPDRLETAGKPVLVVDDLATIPGSAGAQYAVSPSGALAYLPADGSANVELSWLEAGGRTVPLRPAGGYRTLRISPDGRRIALEISENARSDIWLYEWSRDILTRLTLDPSSEEKPLWSPDGRRVVFSSDREERGSPYLYWKSVDAEGSTQRLTSSRYSESVAASSWVPGGRGLAFGALGPNMQTGTDILRVPIDGDEASGFQPGTVAPLLYEPFPEDDAAFSPNGRWLAYRSGESRLSQVFVRRYPELDHKTQVSTEGGRLPTWSRSGQELFYEDPANRIMVVSLTAAGSDLRPGKPTLWADVRLATAGGRNFDVHPDGKRLAVLREPVAPVAGGRRHMVLILDAFKELRRMVTASPSASR